jgi:hypothetical protein
MTKEEFEAFLVEYRELLIKHQAIPFDNDYFESHGVSQATEQDINDHLNKIRKDMYWTYQW